MSKSPVTLEYRVEGVIPPLMARSPCLKSLTSMSSTIPDYPLYQFHGEGPPRSPILNYFEFTRAADRRQGPDGEIVAVVALSDSLLYHAVTLGLMRAGMVPFLMSPRNISAAIIKMLKEVDCHKLLTTQGTLKTLVAEIKADLARDSPGFELEVLEMPPVLEIYPRLGREIAEDPSCPTPKLPFALTWILPFCISTLLEVRLPQVYQGDLQDLGSMGLFSHASPAFHTLGVIPASSIRLRPEPVACTACALTPFSAAGPRLTPYYHSYSLGNLAQDKESVDFLATLKMVGFSGGSVPTKLGNFMTTQGVVLAPIYGATNLVADLHVQETWSTENDWEWMSIDERTGIRWEPRPTRTIKSPWNMDGEKGYATSDCSSLTQLFQDSGRSLEGKTMSSSTPLERRLSQRPWRTSSLTALVVDFRSNNDLLCLTYSNSIMGVIMFGREHDQPGVLIELKGPYAIDASIEAEVIKARNLVWSIVEEANRVAPAFSKVFKELILITDASKPLPRAGKGTVMRKAALSLYHDEIEALYASIDVPPPPAWDKEQTEKWLKQQIEDVLPDITLTSLAICSSKEWTGREFVTQNTIYNYPTIESLAGFLVATVIDPDSVKAVANRSEIVEEMIDKYNIGLSTPIAAGVAKNGTQALITGTTGNLGSQIMETLLRDDSVTRIFAVNHSVLGERYHSTRSRSVKEAYQELLDNITVIIHTAWRLDFNLQLASFEPNVKGVRNLVDLARESAYGSNTRGAYPEEVLLDAQYAVATGYGESKYVAERILSQSGINATSFRIGQIAGGKPNGAWAVTDWVAILVKSSVVLGALPGQIGTSSWVPMDGVAQSIIDVVKHKESPRALNIVHPRPVGFNDLMTAVNDGLATEGVIANKLPILPIQEWFALLEARATGAKDKDIKEVPAIKLLEFFRATSNADLALRTGARQGTESGGMSEFSTSKAQVISKTMAKLPSIDDAQAHCG
ncbi:acetyl-CoA synthetase-like protein [Pholiota molesta]|nr:acetyl-CoA synthetase-like protein [Pholiota molesta]